MMSKEQFEELAQKLDTLIRLVAGNLLKDAKNKTQKVEILYNLGIPTKEISQLANTSEASVETLKTRLRKRTTSKGGKKSGEN
jgi:DNA-binding CsgD family transcriptional regulator